MAVLVGKDGRVTVINKTDPVGAVTWTISQPGPELIDATIFGSSWKQDKIGVRDGGTVSLNGPFNWKTTAQNVIADYFSSGVAFTTGSSFRCWMSTGADGGAGSFGLSTGATLIITSLNFGQDKSGLGTMDATLKISGGFMKYTTNA